MRVNENFCRGMKSTNQILSRGGVDGRLTADRRIDHRDQSRGHLDDGDSPHESGGNEAREIADNATPERDHGGVAAVSLGKQLVRQSSPRFAGLVGLARWNREHVQGASLELAFDGAGVERLDVRVGDERIAVSRCGLSSERAHYGQQGRSNLDWVGARLTAYQVTSPAPVRTFATRASMKRRSESRFK